MTIKAKRAAALRKMEPKEGASYAMGGLVDESFPADDVHNALDEPLKRFKGEVNLREFDAFFGPRLGQYRDISESRLNQPTVAGELALIEETTEVVQQLRLRLNHFPSDTDARINADCWKRPGELFDDFRARLDKQLNELGNLLALADCELERYKGQTGARGKSCRDSLLYDVARWFQARGVGKEAAADAAAQALRAAGVKAPDDLQEARRLVRTFERRSE
ncbi:MAG: hypothetical protein ACRES9_00875 [Gammaproteobacteria bacterium]